MEYKYEKNKIFKLFIFFPKKRLMNFFINIWPYNYICNRFLRPMVARFFGVQIGSRSVLENLFTYLIPLNITIGDDFKMAGDSHFDTMGKITIGNRVTLGPYFLYNRNP